MGFRRYFGITAFVFCITLTGCAQNSNSQQATQAPGPSQKSITLNTFDVPSPLATSRPTSQPVTSPNTTPIPDPICKSGNKVVFNMLLDSSGSMAERNKLPLLQAAVINFTTLLDNSTVLGMQRFNQQPYDLLPIDTMTVNRPKITSSLAQIVPESTTHMKKGFYLSWQKITEAKQRYPDYTFVHIFLSDGIPIPASENPTEYANAMKQQGIRIITIGLDTDAADARQLVTSLASSPSDAYLNVTPAQLKQIYESIARAVCR